MEQVLCKFEKIYLFENKKKKKSQADNNITINRF